MNSLNVFAEKLKMNKQSIEVMEQFWDDRASSFYNTQLNSSTYYSNAVTLLLEQKVILTPSTTVLEIGSGSGRYTIPLAKKCQSIHALDLSSEMLKFLNREIKEENITNVTTIKSAWPTSQKIGEFDVAFAAMCPGTRSVEGLKQMSSVARKHVVICQFVHFSCNVREKLIELNVIQKDDPDPHNNRDLLQSYFNILWELHYNPEINYLHDTYEMTFDHLDEAIEFYKIKYRNVEQQQLQKILQELQQDNQKIVITNTSTLAILNWETTNKYQ